MDVLYEVVDKNADISTIKSIYDKIERPRKAEYLTSYVITKGSHTMLELIAENGMCDIDHRHFEAAAGTSLDLLKTVMKYGQFTYATGTVMVYNAAGAGLIDVLEFLKWVEFDWGPSMAALKYDRLDVFMWLEKHFPDKTYHDFEYIDPTCETLLCAKYLYEQGYMPSYSLYDKAVEAKNQVLIDWLREIKCRGIDDIEEIPDDWKDRLEYDMHRTDLPWFKKLVQTRALPTIEVQYKGSGLSVFKLFSEVLNFPEEDRAYVLQYFVEHDLFRWESVPELYEIIQECEINDRLKVIDILFTDAYNLAELYLCVDAEETIVITHIKTRLRWGLVFLAELNYWIYYEGTYSTQEFIKIVQHLWDKYEAYIPQLQDPQNKTKWSDLISQDVWKHELHEFLSELHMF